MGCGSNPVDESASSTLPNFFFLACGSNFFTSYLLELTARCQTSWTQQLKKLGGTDESDESAYV